MEFDEILNVFGGCLCPEEYSKNIDDIAGSIREIEEACSREQTTEVRATSLLLRAIFSAFKGEINASKSMFDELCTLDLTQSLRYRVEHYKYFCLCLARNPPALRFQEDIRSSSTSLNDTRISIMRALKSMPALNRSIESTELRKLECDYLRSTSQMNWFLKYGRMHHPLYPEIPIVDLGKVFEEKFPFNSIAALAPRARANDLHRLARHLENLALERHYGHHAEGWQDEKQAARSILQDCQSRKDVRGTAVCRVREADALLSPPFTSPIALNFVLENRVAGWDVIEWDTVETNFRFRPSHEAMQLYGEALEIMKRSGSIRAQGLVHLRLACIAEWQGFQARQKHQISSSKEHFENARRQLDDASQYFQGDETNRQIVAAHSIVLDIFAWKHESALKAALSLGKRCIHLGNIVLVHFAGTLFLRLGRYIHRDLLDTATAVQCCQCARECFKGAGEAIFELQAVLAEVTALEESRNSELASIRAEEAQPLIYDAIKQIRGLSADTNFRLSEVNMLQHADKVIRGTFVGRNGHRRLANWDSEWQKHITGLKLREEFQRVLAQPSSSSSSDKPAALEQGVVDELITSSQTNNYLALQKAHFDDRHRKALDRCDMEAAEEQLRTFLQLLDKSKDASFTRMLKLVTLHNLGDNLAAKEMLPSLLPPMYGGYSERVEWSHPKLLINIDSKYFPEGVVHDRTEEAAREQLEESLAFVHVGADWVRGKQILDVAMSTNSLSFAHMQNGFFDWQTAGRVAAIYEHNDSYIEAFEWYMWALNALEGQRLGSSDAAASLQGARSTMHTSGIYEGLTRVALAFSQDDAQIPKPSGMELSSSGWEMRALLFLEQGRARALLDLMTAQKELGKISQELLIDWSNKEYLVRKATESQAGFYEAPHQSGKSEQAKEHHVRSLQMEATKARSSLESHAPEVAAIFASIRFDLPLTDFMKQLGRHDVVVHIHVSRFGLIIFCITQVGIELVHRGHTRDIDMQRLVLSYTKCLREHSRKSTAKETLGSLSADISRILLAPCEKMINDKQHIIFVRPAVMDGFPLSALQWRGQPLMLTHAVSEIPSLAILHSVIHATINRPAADNKISVIADPHLDGVGGKPVPMVAVGALSLANSYNTEAFSARGLTDKAFDTMFQESRIVHIGTHGVVSRESPWQSSIALKEPFRVMDLARLHSKASLVVFAACVSGLGRVTTGNDVTGFSHAILQSGASAYMGALWNISDLTSMVLMYLFHKQLQVRGFQESIAECWRLAQSTLYHSDKESFGLLLEEIRNSINQTQATSFGLPYARDLLDDAIEDLEDEDLEGDDFQHPWYWASFTIVGYAGQTLGG